MTPENLKLLVVDDHSIVRDGIRSLLLLQGFREVLAVSSGQEAVEAYVRTRADVVLMDLRMPQMSGVEAISAIRAIDHEARIMALTTFSGDEDIHRALQAGARGYLLKDATTERLVEAILKVASGETVFDGTVVQSLATRSTVAALTARETEILKWISRGKSNKEIGQALGVAEGTIKTHVNSLLGKLEATDRTDAVVIGLRRGLIQLEN